MIELLWNNPVSEARMDVYLAAMQLVEGEQVLDVGCGAGEALIRLAERFDINGVGIDSSGEQIAEARCRLNRSATSSAGGRVEFLAVSASEYAVADSSFDAVVCMGSSHAFKLGDDAYPTALRETMRMLRPGGRFLIGEGYMRQPASVGYRELLGFDSGTGDHMTHSWNVETARSVGYVPYGVWTSSLAEWDDFEWSYQRMVEQEAEQNATDPKRRGRLERRREWIDGYLRWGRDTLGFGVYLFRKPA